MRVVCGRRVVGGVGARRQQQSKKARKGRELGDYFALALIQEQASHWLDLARIKRAQTHHDCSKSRTNFQGYEFNEAIEIEISG